MRSLNMTDVEGFVGNCTLKAKTPSECYWEYVLHLRVLTFYGRDLFYFRFEVLDISTGLDDGTDEFKWQLVLCLLFSWIIIFLCLIKGIKSSGKVMYATPGSLPD
jgi:hypothetical protein